MLGALPASKTLFLITNPLVSSLYTVKKERFRKVLMAGLSVMLSSYKGLRKVLLLEV